MHTKRRSIVIVLGSLLTVTAVACGMRSNLDEGDSIEKITEASAFDSGTVKGTEEKGEKSFCGDGRLDLPEEQCDGTNLGYATCENLGQGVGTLRCSPGCYFDVSMCRPPPPTDIQRPSDGNTQPIGPDESGYGDNALSDMISEWLNRSRDAGADGASIFGGRNTRN